MAAQTILDLRSELDAAMLAIAGHTIAYTGAPPAAGGPILATQIQRIMNGVK